MKKRPILVVLIMFFISICIHSGEDKIKYFRLDKIVAISGKILRIRMDSNNKKNKFVVLEFQEKKGGEIYDVEVSPFWFYKIDVVEGSIIDLKGSLNRLKEKKIILAQSIIFEGEIFTFRDKFGFPLWRGKGRGFGNKWKGEMRKKGKH